MTGVWVNEFRMERMSVHSDDFKWLTSKMNNSIHTGASVKSYEIVAVKIILFNINTLICVRCYKLPAGVQNFEQRHVAELHEDKGEVVQREQPPACRREKTFSRVTTRAVNRAEWI